MSLRKIALNERQDDLLALLGGVAHRVLSNDWIVYALQDQYNNLIQGRGTKRKLVTYSLLRPSVFNGFASVVVAGACFEDTMMYRLWTGWGVDLQPVHKSLRKELRYDRHPNGGLVTILYATEEEWSKTLRDKAVEVDRKATKLLDRIVKAVDDAMGDEPFLWMGNKDLPDSLFEHKPEAVRLPNSPHGLNEFQGFHRVVVLSALNPPPAHFHFMDAKGVTGDEVKTAHYRGAVYQAVMRCSARNPKDQSPKTFVVMDRTTAEWLAALFPGAEVAPLAGMPMDALKGKGGRKRQHASNAAKNRAYRVRKERELLAQLDLINDTSLVVGRYPRLAREVRSQMSEFADESTDSCDENTVYGGAIVTPFTSGTAFTTVFSKEPIGHLAYEDDDSYIAFLREFHGRALESKEESGVFSPAHFDPALAETGRGLANVRHIRGIWLDNDGGDLSHQEFARLFPYLRVVAWNTYSHMAAKPRWRAFIPTTYAMSLDVHRLIMREIEEVLNQKGYWTQKELDAKPGIRSRKVHGFDRSKFNAASVFYLPCQAKDPKDSFFIDYDDARRGPLDVHEWLGECIARLRPEPEPQPVITAEATTATQAPPITTAGVKTKLQAMRVKLAEEKAQSLIGRREAAVEKAVSEWRSAPRGQGHDGFFRLGAALQRAGLDMTEIGAKLREEAVYAHSPQERRREIRDIMRSLSRRGRF